MKAAGLRFASLAILILSLTTQAHAGVATGSVVNRTTGKPLANAEISLISLMTGMDAVATTKSDAQGQFTFDNPAIGTGPMLVRTTFQGVTFSNAMPPGTSTVTLEVFDVTKDPKSITAATHVIIFQPNGEKLTGAEEYTVTNASKPPQAFFKTEGNFNFGIPEGANLQNVATVGTSGMAVTQAPIEKGKGQYSIAYAFRPGDTSVRLVYDLPYPGNTTAVKLPADYADTKLLLVAPPGVTLTGEGIQPAGQQQGMLIYTHAPLAVKSALQVGISGVGAPQQADAGQGGQEGNSRTQGPPVEAVPGRLDAWQNWPLIAAILAMFGLLAFLLTRKKVELITEPDPLPASKSAAKAQPKSKPAPAATVAAVDSHVNQSLDNLKDAVFRLELRRQAGTIADEEYTRERARLEKQIRDLVQG